MAINVLIVDDSALIRSLLSEIVRAAPDMDLVGAAPDAYVARDFVNRFNPDVITLDIEMPKVDGLTFLEKLMKARPTPVVMISTLTEQGAEATLRAFELGAVDFVAKPKLGVAQGIEEYREVILDKIRTASRSKVKPIKTAEAKIIKPLNMVSTERIVAIGASTGGTEAIKAVLMKLPADSPAIVITQHMPPGFTSTFAQRLDTLCKMNVHEAKGGERLLPGNAYLAPGHQHMQIVKSGADYKIRLHNGDRVSGHKPSVDVMFASLAECSGKNTVAVILTGMGKDGAQGLHQLHQQGAYTIAQNEQTCVVYGMPKEAVKTGSVDSIKGIDDIADDIILHLRKTYAGTRL